MNFDRLIKQLKAEIPQTKADAEEMEGDIKTFIMLKEIKDKKVKTRVDFEKACGSLCYKSLAYCCDIFKPCMYRNAVLDSLNISMKEFREKKMKMHREFGERFDGK